MSNESVITTGPGGTMYAGKDSVELFRANLLKNSLRMASRGLKPTRGFTLKYGLELCRRYTGRGYKRTEVEQAIKDLTVWIETMKSAIPVEHKE